MVAIQLMHQCNGQQQHGQQQQLLKGNCYLQHQLPIFCKMPSYLHASFYNGLSLLHKLCLWWWGCPYVQWWKTKHWLLKDNMSVSAQFSWWHTVGHDVSRLLLLLHLFLFFPYKNGGTNLSVIPTTLMALAIMITQTTAPHHAPHYLDQCIAHEWQWSTHSMVHRGIIVACHCDAD